MRTDRAIDDLENYVIICGDGMFGQAIVGRLGGNDAGIVVLERDEAEVDEALADSVLALRGDTRCEKTLRDADIGRDRTLVTAIDDSERNIQKAITAGQIASTVRLAGRGRRGDHS